MSILELKDGVISFLLRNGAMEPDDFEKITVPDEMIKYRDSIVTSCLNDLEKILFVRKVTDEDDKPCWILENPIGHNPQTVTIGIETANTIASIINRWREANNVKEQVCNILSIDEGDLQNLCNITILSLKEKEIEEDED